MDPQQGSALRECGLSGRTASRWQSWARDLRLLLQGSSLAVASIKKGVAQRVKPPLAMLASHPEVPAAPLPIQLPANGAWVRQQKMAPKVMGPCYPHGRWSSWPLALARPKLGH